MQGHFRIEILHSNSGKQEKATLAEWCQSAALEVFLCADEVQLSNQLDLGALCLMCSNYKEHY